MKNPSEIAEGRPVDQEESIELRPEDDNDAEDVDESLNLPPGRLHTPRVMGRVQGQLDSALVVPPRLTTILRRKQEGFATPRSRSKSPSMKQATERTVSSSRTGTTQPNDANSSISSLEDLINEDILYDRAGLVDMDNEEVQRKMHNSREFFNLPSVNERLSEDTLEDAGAWRDIGFVRSSNASRSSVGTDPVLEPLDECEEDDESDLDDDDMRPQSTVILTNMENLNLDRASAEPVSRAESSLLGEAPSAPTA